MGSVWKDERKAFIGILVSVLIVIAVAGLVPLAVKAGTLEYHANISSNTDGSNITFTCSLDQTVDGQVVSYQWQENGGSGWRDISGATEASYTVNKTGKGGYQYRCNVTITINNTYSLMNEAYKAFLHRQGTVSEFQHWWSHLYGHTQDSYLVTIYDTLGIPPQNEAARVAMEIVFSDEYMKKYWESNLNYTTAVNGTVQNGPKQLVVDCYRFLLQREPSDAEVEYWYEEYVNHNGLQHSFQYPDGNGVLHYHWTFSGIGYVINQIATSAECAGKMAAAYYYNGDLGVFLYTESDIETRLDTYNVTSNVLQIPEDLQATYTVTLHAGTGIQSVSGAGDYTPGVSVAINAVVENGYHWTGWTGTYETDTKQYTFAMPAQNVSMTANAQINHSTLKVDPNGGFWQGSAAVQSFTEHYGTAKSIPDPVRTGYTFSGWVKSEPFNGSVNNVVYTFGAADGATDVLTASWTANSYTLHFDPNDGKEQIPIDDMTITYDQEVVLPDATGLYIRYTLDGEDITQQVLDGTIVLDDAGRVVMMMDADTGLMMTPAGGVVNEDGSITNPDGSITNPDGSVADPEETEPDVSGESTEALEEEATEADASGKAVEEPKEETTEPDASGESMEVPEASGVEEDIDVQVAESEESETPEEPEDPTADPVPDKKAYASVFMGWSLEDGRESFIPQWTAGTSIAVADLTNAAGVTDQSGATITLYAVWDDCPWIVAENLYYTLTQAQSGYITDSEILSHATAYDREDGSPIEPGFHENGTSFSIPDYQASDFTQFRREGSCTENLTVVDSTGSTYYKQITVYVVDTTAVAVKPEGTTRFINEHYYNQSEENGGLAADSIWLTDPEYAAALQTAFTNSRNGTAEEVYEFSHEDILAMKQFIDDNGFGNTRSDDALTRFYNQFMAPNKVE